MNNRGFTFIETIIVLSIVAIISTGTLFLMKPQKSFLEEQLFFTQLQSDLYISQQYAISHQREVTFTLVPKQNYYYARDRYDMEYILKKHYSPSITIQSGSLKLAFKFLPDGNVNQFGTWLILNRGKIYRLTIQLGKGRFYIVEM